MFTYGKFEEKFTLKMIINKLCIICSFVFHYKTSEKKKKLCFNINLQNQNEKEKKKKHIKAYFPFSDVVLRKKKT